MKNNQPGFPDDSHVRLCQRASGDLDIELDFEDLGIPEDIKISGIPKEIKIIPPNFPDINSVHDMPPEIRVEPLKHPVGLIFYPHFRHGESASGIRKAIMDCLAQLPENIGADGIPLRIWLCRPPMSEVIKVKGEIVRTMAYYDWEKAGKPECDGREFWFAAEKRFDNAFTCWT